MNSRRKILAYCAVALALTWGAPALTAEQQRNERTVLTFSSPVQIPGAVLQPGEYVFKLAPSAANNNIVQVFDANETKLITTTLTVPKQRQDPKGDIVLTFGAAKAGEPPALQAFFYPGTTSGHEFVYPESQARDLAMRNRTLVVSHDRKGTDMQGATLRVFNDQGEAGSYVAGVAGTGQEPNAQAPMIMADRQGTKVQLDDLEENPSKYAGKMVSVDGEVEKVLGPRLFTIDEPNWGDLDGEILVFMPSALAALVAENDKVTISGTMRPFVKTELEREWGWLNPSAEIEAEFAVRHVLVAERLIGGNGDLALKLTATPAAVGTSGTSASGTSSTPAATSASGATTSGTSSTSSGTSTSGTAAPGTSTAGSDSSTRPHATTGRAPVVVSIAEAVSASHDSVGRGVDLNNVRVAEIEKDGGFWIRDEQGNRAFVLPQDHRGTTVPAGQQVSIRGVLLEMPNSMRDRLNATKDNKADLYVFATSIKR